MTLAESGTIVGFLSERYARHPGIRALVKLLPGGSSADGLVQHRVGEIRREKMLAFFDELAKGDVAISEELLQSEDFLHCYFRTTEAAFKARRREKTVLFARMLSSAIDSDLSIEMDQFDELLSGLDSLSFREFEALRLLSECESGEGPSAEQTLGLRIRAYWPVFKKKACETLKLEESEFDPFMHGLVRTSFYRANTESFYGTGPDIGQTTRQFAKLCVLVKAGQTPV